MSFKDKVIYQIYPKSFKDTSGNGFGDIKSIISKLDYLKELGVDMLWLNPIFPSSGADNGYDVSDYCAIDPDYGTMEDFEELIKEADKRNIGLMLDMVFNHTSIEHEWFQKALKGDRKYQDYYIFKENIGKLPTNWESKFGGDTWEYVEELDKYYLHLFDKKQADLNWENPEVRKNLAEVVNFWLKKGVKGFRFDVINLISKDEFKDDFEGVGKRFYTDGKKVSEYLQELNENSFGKYEDIVTVGEMSATTVENCVRYTNPENHQLGMVFSFHHLKVDYKDKEKWTLMDFDFKELKELLNDWQVGMQEGNGLNALFLNCHDQPRSISRFGNDGKYHYESATMLGNAMHMLRGTPYIYQGEEIGMTNNYFESESQYRDIESINHFSILKEKGYSDDEIVKIIQAKSRDNARSPMQWDDSLNAGFSSGMPWMDVNPNYKVINVKTDLESDKSIIKYYQKLIKLRKDSNIIQDGIFVPLYKDHDSLYAYKRVLDNQEIVVLNNFYDKEYTIELDGSYKVLLSNYDRKDVSNIIDIKPYEALVLQKQ